MTISSGSSREVEVGQVLVQVVRNGDDGQRLEPRVDGFGFQGEDGEDALVHAPQRLAALQPGPGPPGRGRTRGSASERLCDRARWRSRVRLAYYGVVGAVDQPQVLPAAHLQAGLDESLGTRWSGSRRA